MEKKNIKFPLDTFEEIIINIGWDSLDDWIQFWKKDQELFSIVLDFYKEKFKEDWLWGLILPLLSDSYNLVNTSSRRKIIGLSALPGTGKSTLGLLLEKLSHKLNFKISVISMDDFYLPSSQMDEAIKDNPWEVSRGIPGSHSVLLMEKNLSEWKSTGQLKFPVFDKSLRSGLGDRSYWRTEYPDIVILEGWFLGVNPLISKTYSKENIEPPLLHSEIVYRSKIQENLYSYLDLWKLIDKIWQIKPFKFNYFKDWKCQQEIELLDKKGSALVDDNLRKFLRMLNTSIPQYSFNKINSTSIIILDKQRNLMWVGLNK